MGSVAMDFKAFRSSIVGESVYSDTASMLRKFKGKTAIALGEIGIASTTRSMGI